MSDNLSQVSGTSKTANRNRTKICAYDGKPESSNYVGHANIHHGGIPKEWIPGEELLEKPWCSNWKEVIKDNNVTPMDTLLKF